MQYVFGVDYIMQSGHLIGFSANPHLPYSSPIIYSASNPSGFLLHAILLTVMGIQASEPMGLFFKYVPWQGAVAIPLVTLAIARRLARKAKVRLPFYQQILIFALGAFLAPGILFESQSGVTISTYGVFWFLFLAYLMICDTRWSYTVATLVVPIAVSYQHSFLLVYATTTISIGLIIMLYDRTGFKVRFARLAVLVGVIALAYLVLYDQADFTAYVPSIENGLSSFIGTGHLASNVVYNPEFVFYYPRLPVRVLNDTLSLIIVAVPTVFLVSNIAKAVRGRRLGWNDLFLSCTLLGLGVFGIGLYLEGGWIFVFARVVSEWLPTTNSMLISRKLTVKKSRLLPLVLVIIISLSVTSYLGQGPLFNSEFRVSQTEWQAGTWLSGHSAADMPIFTDFRLAGIVVQAGHFNVMGIIENSQYFNRTDQVFRSKNGTVGLSTAYRVTRLQMEAAGFDAPSEMALFFSSHMADPTLGIQGLNFNQAGASPYFYVPYQIPPVNQIYSNGETYVLSYSPQQPPTTTR